MTDKESISRTDKLLLIGLDENDQIDDEILSKLYSAHIKRTDNKKTKPIPIQVAKDDIRYIIVLKLLNGILSVLNKDPIEDITKFKKINRLDLISDKCRSVLDDHLDPIVKQFGKTGTHYSQRKFIQTYLITVLKFIVKDCGYQLLSSSTTTRNLDGLVTHVCNYSITSLKTKLT